MSSPPEIITVDQLREEIGDPTTSTQFASHISDSTLQAIIDRHIDWMESQSLQRIEEGTRKPVERTEPVEISVSTNSTNPGLTVGQIGSSYFPYATEGVIRDPMDYRGDALDWQPNLFRESQKIFFNGARMFDIENRNVLVYPSDVDAITLYLSTKENAIREIMADQIAKVNDRIIERARMALQARTQEFAEPAYAGGSGELDMIPEE